MERLIAPPGFRALVCGLIAVFTASAIHHDVSAAACKRTTRNVVKPPQCPAFGPRGVLFAKALDGSSFITTDGMEVRLAGVLAPGGGGETVSPAQADVARQLLADKLRTGALTLAVADGPADRYGRFGAQGFAGGAWVQGEMLKTGALRMAPDRAAGPCAHELAAAEENARSTGAGHWGDGVFSFRTPEQLRGRAGSFQMVEGTVTTATTYKGRAYINFGADYRTDFTVTVAPQDMKLFRAARFDVKKLAGKRVRVRGWVELFNGPEMEIATPAAIETLD